MSASVSFQLPETVIVSGASSALGHELCVLLIAAGVSTIGVDLAGAQPNLAEEALYRHVAGDVSAEATWAAVTAPLKAGSARSPGLVTSAAILDTGAEGASV